ncbi:MAG: hypothetical protein KA767_11165 [Saprospiraceae bacterium]|nr:hypothetical protein [Saprospiraceae bacterium]MBP7643895.1 hypothetical protein [Saprospiraceae bacterium]
MSSTIFKPVLFIFIFALICSCEKNEPQPIVENCKLSSYRSQNKGLSKFTYNSKGLVKSYSLDLQGYNTKVELTHNDSGSLVSSLWYFDNVLGSKEIYTYQNDHIIKTTIVDPTNDLNVYGHINIKYDSQGRIIEMKNEFGDPMIDRTLFYSYNAQGLVTKIELQNSVGNVVFVEIVKPKGNPSKSAVTFLKQHGLPYNLIFSEEFVEFEAGEGTIIELHLPETNGNLKIAGTRTISSININTNGYVDAITSSDLVNSITFQFENCN